MDGGAYHAVYGQAVDGRENAMASALCNSQNELGGIEGGSLETYKEVASAGANGLVVPPNEGAVDAVHVLEDVLCIRARLDGSHEDRHRMRNHGNAPR